MRSIYLKYNAKYNAKYEVPKVIMRKGSRTPRWRKEATYARNSGGVYRPWEVYTRSIYPKYICEVYTTRHPGTSRVQVQVGVEQIQPEASYPPTLAAAQTCTKHPKNTHTIYMKPHPNPQENTHPQEMKETEKQMTPNHQHPQGS